MRRAVFVFLAACGGSEAAAGGDASPLPETGQLDVLDDTAAADTLDAAIGDGSADVEAPKLEVVSVLAGGDRTCVVSLEKDLYCWGANRHGEIGDAPSPVLHPTLVAGVTNATRISLGASHSCAVLGDAKVVCWGANDHGQLGDGTTLDRHAPVFAIGGAVDVACGGAHTCAILLDGSMVCWGANDHGQLGDGTTIDRPTPTPVPFGSGAQIKKIALGAAHSCAVIPAGSLNELWCWGNNAAGQVGDGTTIDRPKPLLVNDAQGDVALGVSTTCAMVLDAGVTKLECWGTDAEASFTYGSSPVPATTDPSTPPTWDFIVAGGHAYYAHEGYGTNYSWGSDVYAQLGDGKTTTNPQPHDFIGGSSAIHQFAAGENHACMRMNSYVTCFGKNDQGQVGTGSTSAYELGHRVF